MPEEQRQMADTKKVTVFVGSAHKRGATWRAARVFLDGLERYGDVRGEIVVLSDFHLGVCHGCKACTNHGEERCPLRDDRDELIEKMMSSDGVVFASPNYSFQVSAIMKIFLDRLAFLFHRPSFHGRTFSAIVVQAIGRGGSIVRYLDFVGGGLGFSVVKGSCSRTLEPMSGNATVRMERKLAAQSRRFHARLLGPDRPVPSLKGLMMFRMARTGYRVGLSEDMRDYTWYRDRGWFESDFYYPIRLGPFKKAAGALFDGVAARIFGRLGSAATGPSLVLKTPNGHREEQT
jgi:multimeric flavodoxin WrbA